MIRGLRSIGYVLAQGTLAPRCPACGRPSGHQLAGVCLACWDEVDADRFPTSAAADRHEGARQVAAVGPYRGRLRRVVRCFKFSGMPGLARPLGDRLAIALEGCTTDVVVPVPLHWSRRWRRGYNQADLLARALGRSIGCPADRHALRMADRGVAVRSCASFGMPQHLRVGVRREDSIAKLAAAWRDAATGAGARPVER